MIDIDDFNKFTKAKMKVENYISKMGYTYTVKSLVDMYKNYYCKGYYLKKGLEYQFHNYLKLLREMNYNLSFSFSTVKIAYPFCIMPYKWLNEKFIKGKL